MKYLTELENSINKSLDYKKLENASILITGATGLIGKALTDFLLLIGDKYHLKLKVYAASRSYESFVKRFEKRENLFYFNYSLEDKLDTDISFDYIIHAASNADPKRFANDPTGTMTSNFIGAYNLLEHCREKKVKRFLYVSSGEVYGQWDGKCEAFTEDYSGYVDFTQPRGCYPSSKRAAENLCVCYSSQYGVDTVIVRPSHTYGPTQQKGDSRAMSEFFSLAAEGKDIVLKSPGLQERSYTFVFDCVTGIVTALLNGECAAAYNIANKKSVVSIAQLAKKIAGFMGTQVIFDIPKEGISGASSITRGVLDGTRLENIGWAPRYNIDEGVKITCEIMKENKDD